MKFYIPLLALAIHSASQAAIVQFSDRAAFLAALPSTYSSTDFSNLTPGDQGTSSITLFDSSPSTTLVLATRDIGGLFEGNPFWLSNEGNLDHALGAATTLSDQIRITSSVGFYAIGADWFLGDIEDNYLPGSVILDFSDGSNFIIGSLSQEDSFRGFISDIPITSITIGSTDPTNAPGWVTVDNLVVIPEPSAVLLSGLAVLALAGRRTRSSTL